MTECHGRSVGRAGNWTFEPIKPKDCLNLAEKLRLPGSETSAKSINSYVEFLSNGRLPVPSSNRLTNTPRMQSPLSQFGRCPLTQVVDFAKSLHGIRLAALHLEKLAVLSASRVLSSYRSFETSPFERSRYSQNRLVFRNSACTLLSLDVTTRVLVDLTQIETGRLPNHGIPTLLTFPLSQARMFSAFNTTNTRKQKL